MKRFHPPSYLVGLVVGGAIVFASFVAYGQEPAKPANKLVLAIPYAAVIGTQVADIITTQGSLSRGCIESNPIYGSQPNAGKLAVQKAIVSVPVVALMVIADKHGHHLPSWLMAGAIAGVTTPAVVKNLSCGR